MARLSTFNNLKHGDKIISPLDNEVTEFYLHEGGEYLASKTGLFPISQFKANDFYTYDGKKEVGEVDNDYFRKEQ